MTSKFHSSFPSMTEYCEQVTYTKYIYIMEPSPHEDVKLDNDKAHKYDKGNGEAREYHKIWKLIHFLG